MKRAEEEEERNNISWEEGESRNQPWGGGAPLLYTIYLHMPIYVN